MSKLEEPPDEEPIPGLMEEDENWERFAVLPNAPLDHAFIGEKALQPSKGFTIKLGKEFKALRSSLPGSLHSPALIASMLTREYQKQSLLEHMKIAPT